MAAVGLNNAGIGDQRIPLVFLHLQAQQLVIAKLKAHRISCGQRASPLRGADAALVINLMAQQSHIAARWRLDTSPIAHRSAAAAPKTCGTGPCITHFQRTGNQRTHIDLCALPKQDAIGIDQPHLPIGLDLPPYLRTLHIGNPINGQGVGRRLNKTHRLTCGHIKTLPVQAGLRTGLDNSGRSFPRTRALADSGGTGDKLPARRRCKHGMGDYGKHPCQRIYRRRGCK